MQKGVIRIICTTVRWVYRFKDRYLERWKRLHSCPDFGHWVQSGLVLSSSDLLLFAEADFIAGGRL